MTIQNRVTTTAAASLALATATLGIALFAAPPTAAQAQNSYRRQHRQNNGGITRTSNLAWSTASGRPNIRAGRETGFYIWHDKNTVHVVSSDRSRGRDVFSGTIEIQGRNARFDSLRNEFNESNDRFRQNGDHQLTFRFDTQQSKDGFAFNLRDGERLVFHLNRDGHKTGRIFYGSGQAEASGDPVVFDLHR